jgi:hypothetical protein
VPVALRDVHEEEANAAVADAHRVRRPVVDVAPTQEVRFELRLGDLIGRLAVEGAQHPHRAGVGFLSAFAFAVELQGVAALLSSPSKVRIVETPITPARLFRFLQARPTE